MNHSVTTPRGDAEPVTAALRMRLGAAVWGSPLLVGVSGGADSVALLLALAEVAPAGARIVVAHAEHDLRAAAAADREFVAALAERLGLEFIWRHVAVREADEGGGEGLEARARRLRYAFLEQAAGDRAARHVLVAHTADDQAETILHRILRGTGPAGLAGMRPARELCPGVALVRPLLQVPRADARTHPARRGSSATGCTAGSCNSGSTCAGGGPCSAGTRGGGSVRVWRGVACMHTNTRTCVRVCG